MQKKPAPVHKEVLQDLALVRRKEAACLLENQLYSGAYYIAGYAIELALKAILAGTFEKNTVPTKQMVQSFYTHNLPELLNLLPGSLIRDFKHRETQDSVFASFWGLVTKWTVDDRYLVHDQFAAQAMVNNLNHNSGIFIWLQKRW